MVLSAATAEGNDAAARRGAAGESGGTRPRSADRGPGASLHELISLARTVTAGDADACLVARANDVTLSARAFPAGAG